MMRTRETIYNELNEIFDMEKYQEIITIPDTRDFNMFKINDKTHNINSRMSLNFKQYRKPNILPFKLINEIFDINIFKNINKINFLCQIFIIVIVITTICVSDKWHLSQTLIESKKNNTIKYSMNYNFENYSYAFEVGIDTVYLIDNKYVEYEIKFVENNINITLGEIWRFLQKDRKNVFKNENINISEFNFLIFMDENNINNKKLIEMCNKFNSIDENKLLNLFCNYEHDIKLINIINEPKKYIPNNDVNINMLFDNKDKINCNYFKKIYNNSIKNGGLLKYKIINIENMKNNEKTINIINEFKKIKN